MYRTVVLRFSDAEKATIPEHEQIINTRSSVWWGWWKKQTEQFPLEALRHLKSEAERGRALIGLISRKEEEDLYSAACVDVAFAEDGVSTGSPEPELTPEYYRNTEFPAWFKLTRISSIEKPEFVRTFGFVPASDPTFYEVYQNTEGKLDISPKASWSMKVIKTPGDVILHLSDLHFGADHAFPLDPQRPGMATDAWPLVERISSRVQELGLRVGVIVISGDLITRGETNGYPIARTFVESLLNAFDLEARHCVIVPGNHDLWTEGVEHPSRDYGHERPYRMFLDAVFSSKLQDLERVRRYETPSGIELIFVELNSARLRSDSLREYGYVSKHRYSKLLGFVSDVLKQNGSAPRGQLKFVVLHHHLMPVGPVIIPDEKKPVSLCLDASELISEFQSQGFHFVLHGHGHIPFVGTVGTVARVGDHLAQNRLMSSTLPPKPMYVVGCGSSGARRERLPDQFDQNVIGLYKPTPRCLQVSFEHYSPSTSFKPLWSLTLPVS